MLHPTPILHATSLPCFEEYNQTGRSIWNYSIGTLTLSEGPDTLLNQITLYKSTIGKCTPMLAVELPVYGRVSNTEEQNWSSFQMNYDLLDSTSFASKDSMLSKCHLIRKGGKDLFTWQ